MGDQNESTRVLSILLGVLLFCIVIMCVISLLVASQRKEDELIQDMRNTINSSQMARLTELSMQSEPVFCTAVANVIAEFGDTNLMYIALSEPSAGTTVYTYPGITVTSVSGTIVQDKTPIAHVVKTLLSYSDRSCKVIIGDDNGLPYVLITVGG